VTTDSLREVAIEVSVYEAMARYLEDWAESLSFWRMRWKAEALGEAAAYRSAAGRLRLNVLGEGPS